MAANGNDLHEATAQPAAQRLALGVGAYDSGNDKEVDRFSGGRTFDGRAKPDILGPTNTSTAGLDRQNGRHIVRPYPGTSGSTPYAAGAAALIGQWLRRGAVETTDPGQIF